MAAKSTRTIALTWSLGGTTADTFDWLDDTNPPYTQIYNHHATELLWVRFDGTTAVAEAEGCILVPPAYGNVVFSTYGAVLSIVGNGNKLTVVARTLR